MALKSNQKTTKKHEEEKKKPKSNLPVKAESKSNLPAVQNFERDSGAGFENADRDSYALPFLVILQKMSPQCDEDSDGYVDGAKPGMFFNTATGELFDGKEGVLLVPFEFQRKFNEWVPREQGGGFRGSYPADKVNVSSFSRDESGRFINEAGNHIIDTRYHFCLLLTEEGPQPVVFSLTSTQIKKSRNWMTQMQSIKLVGKSGKKFTPPTFSHVYKATTIGESNEKGDWKGVKIEIDHLLGDGEEHIYDAAKEARSQVSSGKAKIEDPTNADQY